MKKVYLETSVVSYLVAHPSRDLVKTARQEITLEWWQNRRPFYEVYVSQLVLNEASAGDPDAAQRRVAEKKGIPLLDVTFAVENLATRLMEAGILPTRATDDLFHLALASVHKMDFLLTWNCRHLANAELRGTLRDAVITCGFHPPEISTPDELMEVPNV